MLITAQTDLPNQTADNCILSHLKVTLKGLIMEFWLRKEEITGADERNNGSVFG